MSKTFRIIIWLIVNGLVILLYPPEYGLHGGPNYRYKEKQCFSNQRMMLSVIEMYNMDHSQMISEINENVIDILVREKYLKTKISYPDPRKCKYLSRGELMNDGIIYCEYHGSAGYNSNKSEGVPPSKEYEKYIEECVIDSKYHYIKHVAPGFVIFIITTVLAFIL
ncbi:MAG: hypothetical protein II567_10435 [Candidatus Riflebacteria bacterium]|nr:hypothetical protein [Candidatus Riflebacteria bacterium]